jgi:serine/threonine-protein kinase
MNGSPPIDRQTFLANVCQSGLRTEAELAPVLRGLPDGARGRAVARALMEAGLLTRFQAERLLMGRVQGFLLGPYRILEQVGRGGIGRVYKAEHRTMGRAVALKVLAPNLLQTERALELFQHEVRAVGRLVHPNIVTAFDASEDRGRHYIVLEYVDGPNLDQLVRRQGPLPVAQACDYVRQVADGLQCAHNAGMVHRDIKPANLLVQRRGPQEDTPGLVKISDFGLARLQAPDAGDALDHPGTLFVRENTVMGTPDYLSPEQARNLHQTDIRSDLYSLGCTFYFLLTGRAPFPGGSAVNKVIRHWSETPAPLAELRPDVPPAVAAIVERLMAKDPADRFQTPAELAAALEPFSASGPIPWAPAPSTLTEGDGLAAPADECAVGGPVNVLDGASADDLSALAATLNDDRWPTPLPTTEPLHRTRLLSPRQIRAQRLRVQAAVVGAVGIVATLLAAAVLLLTLAGR